MTNLTFDRFRDQWIGDVIRNNSLEPTQKLIAAILAAKYVCEGTGYTFAPISLIANEAEVSEETVESAIERFQEEGFLRLAGAVGKPEEKCYAL